VNNNTASILSLQRLELGAWHPLFPTGNTSRPSEYLSLFLSIKYYRPKEQAEVS